MNFLKSFKFIILIICLFSFSVLGQDDNVKDLNLIDEGEIILACRCLSKDRIFSIENKPMETSNCNHIQTALVIDLDNKTLEDIHFENIILKDILHYTDIIWTNQKLDNYWLTYVLQNYTGFLQITKDYAKAFNGTYYDEYYFQCKLGEKLF